MRASLTWLNDHLDPPLTLEEAGAVLTAVGFPIDGEGTAENGEAWLEVETTSNRGDCLCHRSLALEIAAATGRRVKALVTPSPAGPGEPVPVVNHAAERCPLYTARVIEGVTVGPSPEWLARRLVAIGQIPRNNLVDATNYILWELGQPTHVFDLALLRGPRIEVRVAHPGERFLPLGEGAAAIELCAEDLVIADAERAVALAGIKGGAESAVTAATTSILVEAATFDPVGVRNSSRRLGIRSDSSYRFERGVHPAEVAAAAERLVELILEIAGGTLRPGVAADGLPIPAPRQISLRPKRCGQLLGTAIATPRMIEILERLDLRPRLEEQPEPLIRVVVPPRRLDLEREIDLVEEICRIEGLDAIPVRERLELRPAAIQPRIEGTRRVRDTLAEVGFLECVTHSLVRERLAERFLQPGERLIRVDDERAGGAPILRPSLVPSLLEVLARNEGLGEGGLGLFEVASTFRLHGDGHRESREAGLVLDGGDDPQGAFRRLRGAIERIAAVLSAAPLRIEPADGSAGAAWLAPQMAIVLGAQGLGRIGLLDGAIAALAGVDRPVLAAELDLEVLLAGYPPLRRIEELPSVPAIERDLSIVVDESVAWAALERCVGSVGAAHLESIRFTTTWRGKALAGRKSVTMRLRFRDPARTLRHEEIEGPVAQIVEALRRDLGGELRGGAA